ncbi:MAG: ComEC/Rec2 family competence protein [Candidatus Vogelbacteria bacterium]|nr:ComEC/Rec2 family competence protein [Candidatus Vogelbacteria bacterium]
MRRNVYIVAAGFIVGTVLYSFARLGASLGAFSIVSAILIALFQAKTRADHSPARVAAILFCIGFALGTLRYAAWEHGPSMAGLDGRIGSMISTAAIVVDEPDAREDGVRFVAEFEDARAIVFARRYPEVRYGDRIRLKGLLDRPENFSADFDWVSYLAKDGITFQFFRPSIEIISHDAGSAALRALFRLKAAFLRSLGRSLPEPASALAGGLIVGGTNTLGTTLTEDFRRVGLSHIVVLSGFNVTIIADAIIRVFAFLPRVAGISFAAIGIAAFALMTGATATVVRASVMALIALLARATGRVYLATAALCAAGLAMVLYNPNVLVFDTSFQLSFLATLGLIYLSQIVERRLFFFPERFGLRSVASATIGAYMAVTPLLLYRIGDLSIVALPVNMLVLPIIPMTMLFSFLTGVASAASAALATPFAYVAYILLAYELWVVRLFSALSFASVEVSLPLFAMCVVYTVLIIWVVRNRV